MSERKSIEHIKMKVWAEAAGRCQFRGCNTHLWYNDVTKETVKWGEIAHIIGASRNGPRGRWDSKELQDDPDNLMLLCEKCHKTIDFGRNVENYPAERLIEMKKEHEDRIRLILDVERNKTTVVQFTCPIKGQPITISDESVYNATLPNYPDELPRHWYKMNMPSFDYTDSSWSSAKSFIDQEVDRIERTNSGGSLNNLSIFGIGPMPLLIYLGTRVSDTIPGEVYHANRNNPPEKRFNWVRQNDDSSFGYKVKQIKEAKSNKVILLLALSDNLPEDKYSSLGVEEANIYQITIDSPTPLYLESKSQLTLFGAQCRSLLNEIQFKHGNDCDVHVLPAVPAAVAITFGRLIMPTKDPKMFLYEYFNGNPKMVIELN